MIIITLVIIAIEIFFCARYTMLIYKILVVFILIGICNGRPIPQTEVPLTKLSAASLDKTTYIWRYGGPYGYYCGLMHTSKMFDEPIDAVDRACQLHDTCISSAEEYLDCTCNEQLLLRMYDTCPVGYNATYYRDQIIRAMNIGTSLCNSECDLTRRYFVSQELGYNGIPFYGPDNIVLSPDVRSRNILYGFVDRSQMRRFALDNFEGRLSNHLGSFKKLDGVQSIDVPENEVLMVIIDPTILTMSHQEVFHAVSMTA